MRDEEKGMVKNEWREIFSDPSGQVSVRMGRNKGEEDLRISRDRNRGEGNMANRGKKPHKQGAAIEIDDKEILCKHGSALWWETINRRAGHKEDRNSLSCSEHLPECFAVHVFLGDPTVGERLVPHGIQRVANSLGLQFIGLQITGGEKKTSIWGRAFVEERQTEKNKSNSRKLQGHLASPLIYWSALQFSLLNSKNAEWIKICSPESLRRDTEGFFHFFHHLCSDGKIRPCRLRAADAAWRRDRPDHWNPLALDPKGKDRSYVKRCSTSAMNLKQLADWEVEGFFKTESKAQRKRGGEKVKTKKILGCLSLYTRY